VNAAELALYRAAAADPDLMPDTADILRITETETESGGSTTGEAAVVIGVRCRLEAGGTEELVAARLAGVVPWEIAFPYGTDVDHKDRVVIPSGGTQTFEVGAVLRGGAFEFERRVSATEVRR
jgi:hypothetical protein